MVAGREGEGRAAGGVVRAMTAAPMRKRNRPSLGRTRQARGNDCYDTPPVALEPLFALSRYWRT